MRPSPWVRPGSVATIASAATTTWTQTCAALRPRDAAAGSVKVAIVTWMFVRWRGSGWLDDQTSASAFDRWKQYRSDAAERQGERELTCRAGTSFPGSAWERTVFEAPPRVSAVAARRFALPH